MSNDIKNAAEKEMKRMDRIFESIDVSGKGMSLEFYKFAKAYFEDGQHFFTKNMYVESFEASIIAWAYIDAGLKLDFFKVKEELKDNFTA